MIVTVPNDLCIHFIGRVGVDNPFKPSASNMETYSVFIAVYRSGTGAASLCDQRGWKWEDVSWRRNRHSRRGRIISLNSLISCVSMFPSYLLQSESALLSICTARASILWWEESTLTGHIKINNKIWCSFTVTDISMMWHRALLSENNQWM